METSSSELKTTFHDAILHCKRAFNTYSNRVNSIEFENGGLLRTYWRLKIDENLLHHEEHIVVNTNPVFNDYKEKNTIQPRYKWKHIRLIDKNNNLQLSLIHI